MKNLKVFSYILAIAGLLSIAGCKQVFQETTETQAPNVTPFTFTGNPLPESEQTTLTEPPSSYVFDINAVPKITITITKKDWNQMLTYFDSNRTYEIYVPADFQFEKNGVVEKLRNIGIRVRGNNFSRHRPEGSKATEHDPEDPEWHHCHFRLNFREYDRNARFHDLRAVNLKWFNNDPTYIRDVYCYDLFHRFGVSLAPRSTYCRVFIYVEGDYRPAYYGVYEMVESLDDEFLSVRFPGNDNGHLWKCLYPASLRSNFPHAKMGIEDPNTGYNPTYDYKSKASELEEAKAQFLDFIEKLNKLDDDEFEKWIGTAFDVDMFLRAYAVNVMVGMWDDYWFNQNNYYFYFDENGKAYFIPYDYDNTLGTSILSDVASADVFEWGPTDDQRPLISRILKIEKYRQTYAYYIAQLIAETNKLFDAQASVDRIRHWQSMIEYYVDNDTGDDTEIYDAPADWGRNAYYKLLSGTWEIVNYESNYFLRRIRFAEEQLGLPVTERSIE